MENEQHDERPIGECKKTLWTPPALKRIKTESAELGLGVGADLIITGTSS